MYDEKHQTLWPQKTLKSRGSSRFQNRTTFRFILFCYSDYLRAKRFRKQRSLTLIVWGHSAITPFAIKMSSKYWTERRTKPLLSELETQLIIAKCNKNTHKNKKLTLKCFDLCKFGDRKSSLWALLERMHRWDVWNLKRKASWGSWFVLLRLCRVTRFVNGSHTHRQAG